MTNETDAKKIEIEQELEDEPLTIEKHLTDDLKGGLVSPDPAPDRGPYQTQEPKGLGRQFLLRVRPDCYDRSAALCGRTPYASFAQPLGPRAVRLSATPPPPDRSPNRSPGRDGRSAASPAPTQRARAGA